jgi:hypothetical protein
LAVRWYNVHGACLGRIEGYYYPRSGPALPWAMGGIGAMFGSTSTISAQISPISCLLWLMRSDRGC